MHIFGMITTKASTAHTALALESFIRHTWLEPDDIFLLIDNDCVFELPAHLNFDQLRIIRNQQPESFARNMNSVIDYALQRLCAVVLLHDRIIFTADWFPALCEFEDKICSSISNREIQYEADNFEVPAQYSLEEYAGHEHLVAAVSIEHKKKFNGYCNTLALPFFATRIPYQVLSAVGYLDEGYGATGGEDYDYCMRASLDGFRIAYAMSSYVLHFGGSATNDGSPIFEEPKDREARYFKLFEEKWGKPLTDVVLRQKIEVILDDPALKDAIEREEHGEVVASLAALSSTRGSFPHDLS